MKKIIWKIEMTGEQIGRKHAIWLAGVSLSIAAILASPQPVITPAFAAPATTAAATSSAVTPKVQQFMRDADSALKTGNLNLAVVELKNAVQLAPDAGEPRAKLGLVLLQQGQAVAAERELRQARQDFAPEELVVPGILQAMLMRKEANQLLVEFPDPPAPAKGGTVPDILRARAIALQALGRTNDATGTIDRALKMRRDVPMLLTRASIAQQQGDFVLARNLLDEGTKIAPLNEQAFAMAVSLLVQTGETQNALVKINEFLKRNPTSEVAQILRINMLLQLNRSAEAKQDIDNILKKAPGSRIGTYYDAVVDFRSNNPKGAWQKVQRLTPEFVQADPNIAATVATIALANGNRDTAGAILASSIARYPDSVQARFLMASIELQEQHPEQALKTLEPLKNSNQPQVQSSLAQAYLQLRRYGDATTALEKATNQSNGANRPLNAQLAVTEMRLGATDEGFEGLEQLSRRDPSDPNIAFQATFALLRRGKIDDALAVTDRFAKAQPKSPLPHFYRGLVFISRHKLNDAATAFGQALSIDPKFMPARLYRSQVSVARGESEAATKDLQQILADDPATVTAYLELARIAFNNDQRGPGLALLNKAIQSAPADPTPRLALANYQLSQKEYGDAQSTLSALLKVSPNHPGALMLQGEIQFATGAEKEAVATFRKIATANPNSPDAQLMLATALNTAKDQSGSESAARKAIELSPDSPDGYLALISLQIGHGKSEMALATARKYASTHPGLAADLLTADTLDHLNRPSEAYAVLEKSFDAKPEGILALRLVQIAMKSGNAKKTTELLSKWVQKHPDDYDVRETYASLLMKTGDQQSARREYEAVLRERPEDATALNNLGWLIEKENPARALSLVSLGAKIAPRSPEILDTLGWLKVQQKDLTGSLPILKRAHDLDPTDPEIGYHLAVALDATGKRTDAKALLNLVLARSKNFADAQTARQLVARW